mmetsp:Transcript_37793/g.55283  ORF Transcript_37793/g.55283 Transcript_37793/m.55283 type:complete len:111 (-) Transcript_37793:200-532(-)
MVDVCNKQEVQNGKKSVSQQNICDCLFYIPSKYKTSSETFATASYIPSMQETLSLNESCFWEGCHCISMEALCTAFKCILTGFTSESFSVALRRMHSHLECQLSNLAHDQ